MKTSTILALFGVLSGIVASETATFSQPPAAVIGNPTASKTQRVLDRNAIENLFTFVVFYKDESTATSEMLEIVRHTFAKRPECSVVSASVREASEKVLIERLGIGRAPMPLTVAIAPNGAVTGVFTRTLTAENLEAAVVTPTMAKCMKSLQGQKLVFVIPSHDEKVRVPAGVQALLKDPAFRDRIVLNSVRLDDPAETRLFKQMKLESNKVDGPYAVLIAPPGVLVGHFDAASTSDVIAAAIHKSGQCCDDPNCKHNRPAVQQAAQPSTSGKN